MPKRIIFCADGTWNGPNSDDNDDDVADPTNVLKTFLNLAGRDSLGSYRLSNEQERVLDDTGRGAQIAKYLHGVGDSNNFLVQLLGGMIGAGVITRIIRGYTFVSRNYDPGDDIYLIGFSRGAYTARALGGLITAMGLLDRRALDLSDHNAAYRLAAAVWHGYRRKALASDKKRTRSLDALLTDLPGFFSAAPTPHRVPDVVIKAIAVWDTVGALGIPQYTTTNDRLDVFQFANTVLSNQVTFGLHAVSIDECRSDFSPTLWSDRENIKQALFAGAHADIGGGYATTECGLSDCALEWMTSELAGLGLLFATPPAYAPDPSPIAKGHTPWLESPWTFLPTAPRSFPAGLKLHPSVSHRLTAMGHGMAYAPTNIAGLGTMAVPALA